jgi:type II secretory pathway pseudopilin PulG
MIGNKKFKKNKKHHKFGFTIIETLTTFFIFTLILAVFSATTSSVIRTYRQSVEMQRMQEDASFVLEAMSKEIRISQFCLVGSGPACNANVFTVTHPVNGVISYSRNSSTNIIERNIVGTTVTELSSADISYTNLDFFYAGVGIDDRQARVIIRATVQGKSFPDLMVKLQTTITSRDVREEFQN